MCPYRHAANMLELDSFERLALPATGATKEDEPSCFPNDCALTNFQLRGSSTMFQCALWWMGCKLQVSFGEIVASQCLRTQNSTYSTYHPAQPLPKPTLSDTIPAIGTSCANVPRGKLTKRTPAKECHVCPKSCAMARNVLLPCYHPSVTLLLVDVGASFD